jgi:hypothetical protein
VGVRNGALRSALLVAAVVVLIAPTPLPGPPCPSPNPPRPEARHRSGLALPTPLPHCFGPSVYEPLAIAYINARMLAESHPNDFGYPWDDRAKGELVISVIGPTGEALARSWMASGATYASGTKETVLPRPAVPVRFRTVTRSFAQLTQLEDDIIGALRAGLLPDASVRSFGHDDEYDRIVMDVQFLSDAFATALVSRFGTEAIAVRVDPTYGPFTSTGQAIDANVVDPALVALLLAGSFVGLGLVVFVMKRRAR